ncbi:unnamed protein product [marine sediment metagenome]|uniref:Uncharacterized protein n=1 Tax=marine sediment metagenome TaxID=412755 RepID=X1GY30_9ZZZZ
MLGNNTHIWYRFKGGKLDEDIGADQIREICVIYDNIGEGDEWEASVPFTIIKKEEVEDAKR